MNESNKRALGCLVVIIVLIALTRSCSCRNSSSAEKKSSQTAQPQSQETTSKSTTKDGLTYGGGWELPLELINNYLVLQEAVEILIEKKGKTDPEHAIAPKTIKFRGPREWSITNVEENTYEFASQVEGTNFYNVPLSYEFTIVAELVGKNENGVGNSIVIKSLKLGEEMLINKATNVNDILFLE